MRGFLEWLGSKFESVTIKIQGVPYLTRYYLIGKDTTGGKFSLFLHHFHTSDQRDELHNHPWRWAFSLILSGGYSEERIESSRGCLYGRIIRRDVGPGSINFIRANDFHRADLYDEERGAWTLFFAGPRSQDWGFVDRETRQYKDHRENPEAIP